MPSINITASDDKNLLPFQIQSYLIMVSTIICQSTEEQRLEKKNNSNTTLSCWKHRKQFLNKNQQNIEIMKIRRENTNTESHFYQTNENTPMK